MNWEQFRAILWLRWRLTRNQLTRGSGFGAVIAAIAGVMFVVLAVGAGLGAFTVGALALGKVPPYGLMFVCDGILFFVIIFSLVAVLVELQRTESVDLTRLLHLPISLKQVFVFNYLASLISLGTVLSMAILFGLMAGLTINRGFYFLLAMPLVAGFVFMLTAWIYCLRGWLVSLMVNPRRRRSIIMWITIGIVLVGQSPQLINLAYQRKARQEREARRAAQQQSGSQTNVVAASATTAKVDKGEYFIAVATRVHPWVPLLWLPNGVRGLAAGDVLPALWGSAGMFALGWLGLSRAYRSTLKFYRADEPVKPGAAKPVSSKPGKPARNWVTARLPWLAEDTAALALAQCRSMTRAPEVRMTLAMGLFMAIFLPVMMFWGLGHRLNLSEAYKPFIATGAVVMILFMLLQLVCNQFGCDRDGFRGLVLLPTSRDRILFGKNLALFPLAMGLALMPLVAVAVLTKLSLLVALATLLQFVAAFLMYCTLGNLASILVPFRIAAGSLKPTKQSWQAILGTLLVFFTFPVVITPVFIPAALGLAADRLGWLPAAPVNFLTALALAAGLAVIYWLTLRPLGRLLQRRETNILRAVTEAAE